MSMDSGYARSGGGGAEQHLYLDPRVAADTLKKVVLHSVATALASIVLPVPGGPNSSTPCGPTLSQWNVPPVIASGWQRERMYKLAVSVMPMNTRVSCLQQSLCCLAARC